MLITDITVIDNSNTADVMGHVAITTEQGVSYFECHAMGQGDAAPQARHDMLVSAALDQMQRLPTNRREKLTIQLGPSLAA
ncbi:hypothetical protein [Pseudaestuariivita atlantica]|uniref:Uncharacterized protein n=1 Tax=Pseudaestuariivita atlantica TaxID=1317121 RepID=A0A0L1JS52_9RHOB|nr:hypothetical protein [Pseudaestuariivita atlantica]KNG94527.1 hypothetical protein ATO11_03660 [Pseudaestuariivita atlantica]